MRDTGGAKISGTRLLENRGCDGTEESFGKKKGRQIYWGTGVKMTRKIGVRVRRDVLHRRRETLEMPVETRGVAII